MGVCCIVFGIDGMLFEFFMNFFNIEKYKILNYFLCEKIYFFLENNSFSFHVLYYFQH